MDKKLMLEQMINHYADGNQRQFSRILNIGPQTVNSWLKRETFDAEIICNKIADISASWLLTGEGEMLTKCQSDNTLNNVHNSNVAIGENIDIKTTCKKDAAAEAKTSENSKMVEVLLEMVRSQKETIEQLTELCRKMGEKK